MKKQLAIAMWLLFVFAVNVSTGADDATKVFSGDKTLVAWVAPADLKRQGGGVLSIDNLGGGYDGIFFGEVAPAKWMAGSNWFQRTERNQKDWPTEAAGPGTFVQIAIVYKGNEIALYRNGQPYAKYTTTGEPIEFGVGAVVTMGIQGFNPGGVHFAGKVADARIYSAALSPQQVAALKSNQPSDPAPWAWWNFRNNEAKEVTGRFETLLLGGAKIANGALELDGKDAMLVGMRGAMEPGLPKTPPAPKEYAYVYSAGYGQENFYPKDLAEFEKLIVNLREGGFNTIHCIYKPEYVEICRKHGMKIMLDVLAWKPPVEQDIRRPAQQATVLEICRKVRGDDTIWGYNLWNERFQFFQPGGVPAMSGEVLLLRKWDPTHPIWVGTYLSWWDAKGVYFNPGCPAYYDYPWERGLWLNFFCLNFFNKLSAERDMYFGRWMRNHDYCRSTWTMNTGIACGMKTGVWFICGPWHPHNPTVFNKDDVLCKIGRDYQRLWPEIGKIGRPIKIYTTPTKARGIKRTPKDSDLPIGVAIPADFPIQVKSGELLFGHFRYPDGTDALYVASHQFFAPQDIALEIKGKGLRLEMFDRQTGQWKPLQPENGVIRLRFLGAAAELLRVKGGKLP